MTKFMDGYQEYMSQLPEIPKKVYDREKIDRLAKIITEAMDEELTVDITLISWLEAKKRSHTKVCVVTANMFEEEQCSCGAIYFNEAIDKVIQHLKEI